MLITLALAFAGLGAPAAEAGTVPSMLQSIGTFSSPVFVTSDPTDPNRELVVEKDGLIIASENGVKTTFLDIEHLVSNCSERGLLSMAFPPDYATTGLFYVLYNRSADPSPALQGDIQVDEFQVQNGSVSMASQRHVLTIDHPSSCQHNGGQMQFGPDGYLYISTGDGYDYNAPQDLNSLLGKVLRIWPRPGNSTQYTIPADNPYRNAPGSDEIWSYGLRNPWRFSFDRLTGAFVLADVGDATSEEIDFDPAAAGGRADNYGWSVCEGFDVRGGASPCNLVGATAPAYTYPHTDGRCAITGGYVARDQSLGALYGRYLFADLCTGQVYSAQPATPTITDVRPEPITVETPTTFGEDACGRLYLAELGGAVYRLVGDTPATCGAPDPGADPGGSTSGGSTSGGGDPAAGGGGTGEPGGSDPPAATCGGEAVTQAVPQTGGRMDGTTGDDVIAGSDEADRIVGHGGADLICAGDGDDTVSGGGGADKLLGGPGADGLNGGGGTDHCKGGPGKDTLKSC